MGINNGYANGKYMAAELTGGDNVTINRSVKGAWETFNIHYARDDNNASNACLGHNQLIKIQTLGGYWLTVSATGNIEALATTAENAATFAIFKLSFFEEADQGECIPPGGSVFFRVLESNQLLSQQNDNAVSINTNGSLTGNELFTLSN